MEEGVFYGLEVTQDEEAEDVASGPTFWATAYRITIDKTGVWLDNIATFRNKEMAHAFIRAWNGEGSPS